MLDKEGKLYNREFRVELTNRCNAHCLTCPREKMTRPKEIMTTAFFSNVLEQAKDLGAEDITLFGYGESLLDRNLDRKVRLCTEMGFHTHLTTNASLLDVSTAHKLLYAGLTDIRFSVHSPYKANYERIHGGLKFDAVMRNIYNFIKINETKFDSKCVTHVSVMPMYDETVEEIKDFWLKKIDYLEIWRPHNWLEGRTYRRVERLRKTCFRPERGPVQVQVDGTLIPCCFMTNSELIMGDAHMFPIRHILNNKKYKALRHAHRKGKLTGWPCERCDQLNIEEESPLLYSNRDEGKCLNTTSSTKFNMEVQPNGNHRDREVFSGDRRKAVQDIRPDL